MCKLKSNKLLRHTQCCGDEARLCRKHHCTSLTWPCAQRLGWTSRVPRSSCRVAASESRLHVRRRRHRRRHCRCARRAVNDEPNHGNSQARLRVSYLVLRTDSDALSRRCTTRLSLSSLPPPLPPLPAVRVAWSTTRRGGGNNTRVRRGY